MAKHSPLPWRLAPGDNPPDFSRTVDDRGCFVFGDNSGPKKADAALIVRAVNERDTIINAYVILSGKVRELAAEAEKLKDLVRRMLPGVEREDGAK